MSVRLYTRIATTIAVVAVAAARRLVRIGRFVEGHVKIPANLANFREPGSTGYVPMTTQAWLENFRKASSTGYVPMMTQAWLENFRKASPTGEVPETTHVVIPAWLENFREPGSTGFVPAAAVTVASPADRGLDWVSAVIGAGTALGLAIAGAGAFVTVRKRRTLVHA